MFLEGRWLVSLDFRCRADKMPSHDSHQSLERILHALHHSTGSVEVCVNQLTTLLI